MSEIGDVLGRLEAVIRARQGGDPGASYTAQLLAAGPERRARKLGEEALETVIAAIQKDRAAVTAEAADLVYHLLVVLVGAGVSLDDLADKLAEREGRSGLEEKASRPKG